MRFRPFLKMPAAREARERSGPGGTWVALEKLHGAQLVVGVRAGEVWFGKRKAWLAGDEPFFGWQLLRAELTASAVQVARAVGGERDVYLYGELFGGRYPHPDVPAVAGMAPVQTGIWYAPELRWAVFDVLVAGSEEDEGELLAHHEVEALAHAARLLTPPVVRRGARSEMGAVPTRATTRVPALLGLPPLDGNVAEGLVIKADARATPSERMAWKRKIEEFDEARFDESAAWDAQQRLSLEELVAWAGRLVNPARITSAVSKCGRDSRAALLDEVVLDVRVDLELAFPAAYRALTGAEEETLDARIRERTVPLLEAALR
ncbi:RNA ligase family protein [Pyxidicoccus sp. 3LG]